MLRTTAKKKNWAGSRQQTGPRPVIKASASALAVLCCCSLCLVSCFLEGPGLPAGEMYGVIRLIDGDTFQAAADFSPDRTETIRLWSIDCPEMDQPFGSEALEFLDELLPEPCTDNPRALPVYIERVAEDVYGRTIARVYLADGSLVAGHLVAAGLAWVYRVHCTEPWLSELSALEDTARTAGLGLWSDPAPIPPWEWRENSR